MKTQAVYDKQIKAMGKALLPDFMPLIRSISFGLLGIVCSQFDVVSGFSPFCAALVGAVPQEQCFAAFAGSCIGYLLSGGMVHTLRYSCMLALLMGVRIIFSSKLPKLNENAVCCTAAALLSAVSCVIHLALYGFSSLGVVLCVCESAAAAGFCYIFKRSFATPVFKIGIRRLRHSDAAFIAVSCCAMLLCATGISIGMFCPAHIAAVFAVLLASHYRGCQGGSCVGTVLGAVLCLKEETRHMFAAFSLGGISAGLFSVFGQFGAAIAFAAASCLVALFEQGSRASLISLFESALACIAFVSMPPSWLIRAENYLDNSGFVNEQTVNREVAFKLRCAAQTVADVSDIVVKVTQRMDEEINPQESKVFARVQQTVCSGCDSKGDCWGDDFDSTARDVLAIVERRQNKDGETTELESRCERFGELASQLTRDSAAYANTYGTVLQINELRGVVSDQFSCISGLLEDISSQIAGNKMYDTAKSGMIRQALRQERLDVESASFWMDVNGKATVEAVMYKDASDIEYGRIRRIIDSTVLRSFDSPEVSITDLHTVLSFPERPSYDIRSGCSQYSGKVNSLCGDSTEAFCDVYGNAVVLLSDGMGTGARAAIDGTMTATLMKKLISSGFSFDNALKMVNSALLIKSSDESLATVDGLHINVYTGCAAFYKAGAAPSFIRSGSTVTYLEQKSLPAGILRGIEFAVEERMLSFGDIVLLVSDGVTSGDCGWITDELLAWSTDSMKDLAVHIASLARLRNDEENRDDITVVAVKAAKNRGLSYETAKLTKEEAEKKAEHV